MSVEQIRERYEALVGRGAEHGDISVTQNDEGDMVATSGACLSFAVFDYDVDAEMYELVMQHVEPLLRVAEAVQEAGVSSDRGIREAMAALEAHAAGTGEEEAQA